eukprot:5698584-Lingulodinium_polyedra.AAC.1
MVVGDMKCSISATGIEGVLAMNGWADMLANAGHTCYPSSGTPSRIDVVLANRGARAWTRAARVRWDLGIATRAVLQIDLE